MDIHNVRQQLKTKSIYDIDLRVTFYARVSSDSDEQLNSLDNQIAYYSNLISKNEHWVYVPGYIDEGISGISTQKRENFNRMISDSADDKFDLVITKEISRFARNTLDSIKYTRELLLNGVGVFFQNDNINTLDEDSELRLSIMSSIAQDELRKLSSRIRFGHQQAIKSNVVLGNSRIFGYRKDDCKLVIDESEAPMVRELFELYASDNYSLKRIEEIFWDKGHRNRNGNKISHNTLSGIIANPKYKGYYVGNKVKVVDMFTKKQRFLPPEEWVMFKDETGNIVPAIVSEEVWDRANEVLKRRSNDVKNRQGICNHDNLLTGKLYCTECGAPYYRRDSMDTRRNPNSKWVCSGKIKNGAKSCNSFAIYESDMQQILFEVFNGTKVDVEALIAKYLDIYSKATGDNNLAKQVKETKSIIENEERKKNKLLQLSTDGKISDDDFYTMTQTCNEAIGAARERLAEIENQEKSNEDFHRHIAYIKEALRRASKAAASGMIGKEFVQQYIDKIFVTPISKDEARLVIKICTGRDAEAYLKRVRGKRKECESLGVGLDTREASEDRAGNMSLEMMPTRTLNFERIDRTELSHKVNKQYIALIAF